MATRPLRRAAAVLVATAIACATTTSVLAPIASAVPVSDRFEIVNASGTSPSDTARLPRPGEHGRHTEPGDASMSSPYIAGVPHVPADVLLFLAPEGPLYVGRPGSLFNGPADEVGALVDEWWAEQMASGTTPDDADRRLAAMGR